MSNQKERLDNRGGRRVVKDVYVLDERTYVPTNTATKKLTTNPKRHRRLTVRIKIGRLPSGQRA